MNKKKTSKKHEFSLDDISAHTELVEGQFDITDKTMATEFKPEKLFKNKKKVAEALLQCLIENDTESYMEILDSYLRVN